jgi:hypothetical protein
MWQRRGLDLRSAEGMGETLGAAGGSWNHWLICAGAACFQLELRVFSSIR